MPDDERLPLTGQAVVDSVLATVRLRAPLDVWRILAVDLAPYAALIDRMVLAAVQAGCAATQTGVRCDLMAGHPGPHGGPESVRGMLASRVYWNDPVPESHRVAPSGTRGARGGGPPEDRTDRTPSGV